MLITIEQLLKADVIDLDQICVVAVPMLNPYGYRNGARLNANGVDLNRQLRKDWKTFRGWTDEVIEPCEPAEPLPDPLPDRRRPAPANARNAPRPAADRRRRQHLSTHCTSGAGVSPVLRKRRPTARRSRHSDADRSRGGDQPDDPPPRRAVVEEMTLGPGGTMSFIIQTRQQVRTFLKADTLRGGQ